MKIIILEGIATSGKTTIKDLLVSEFKKRKLKFAVINEEQTLIPILENTNKDVSVNFMSKILDKFLALDKDVLIFDRFYFTHIFRTSSKIENFIVIENKLSKYNILLVLLTINEDRISERVQHAISHRDQQWSNFVKKKGNDFEIEKYYIEQQRLLLKLLEETKLRYMIKDSTSSNFEEIVKSILKNME